MRHNQLFCGSYSVFIDLNGVMADPAPVVDLLLVGQVGPAQKQAVPVQKQRFCARGALVNAQNVFHSSSFNVTAIPSPVNP